MVVTEETLGASNRQEWNARVAAWSPEERAEKEKKFVRRIDIRLLPILVRKSLPTSPTTMTNDLR
jgi:hypothetical protein